MVTARSNHLNSRLRVTGVDNKTIKTFSRVRNNLSADQAKAMLIAVDIISNELVVSGFLTVTSELTAE